MSLNNLLLASNVAFFALSAFAVVASIAVFLLTRANDRAKDRELRRYQLEASQTVAQAHATAETAGANAAKANERAGEANKEAARANERAGQLEKEAAQLRLAFEQEKVKRLQLENDVGRIKPQVQSLMPSEIEPARIAALVQALKDSRGSVSISYDGGDTKAQPLSVQLQRAFHEAGWSVSSGMMIGIALPPKTGVMIRGNAGGLSEMQQRAVAAMEAAQIPFDLRLDRQTSAFMSARSDSPPGNGVEDVEIVVTAPQR